MRFLYKGEQIPLTLNKYGVNDLTPIEKYNGIYFKRDDKFQPFKDIPLNGGKLRQAFLLLYYNYIDIKHWCDGHVGSATSMLSPQGIIITRVAKEFGFKTYLAIGGKRDNSLILLAKEIGAIIKRYNIGYEKTLITMLKQEHKFFMVKFGLNVSTNRSAIINANALQVKNIPDKLDMLVIPVGSGISMAGILAGIKRYKKKVKRIIGIQIAGYDRRDVIDGIVSNTKYEFYQDKTYPYHKLMSLYININESLDPLYESKAFEYFINNFDFYRKKVLFWIVGDTTAIRKFKNNKGGNENVKRE